MKPFVLTLVLIALAVIEVQTSALPKITAAEAACLQYGPPPQDSNRTVYAPSKTLSIILDTTGSMWDDLQSLRSAAVEIVKKFVSYENNPIEDYVLSLFNDPGAELKITKDSEIFLQWLNEIVPGGGGDCPELAMEGIINALKVSRPNSIAFVFTDADALDYGRVNEAIDLVQEKQTIVNFLTTEDCQFEWGALPIQRKVFFDIAQLSGGIVFSMIRPDVDRVLLAIINQLERDFTIINSFELPRDIEATRTLKIDSSVSQVTISMNGLNPVIRLKLVNIYDESETTVSFNTTFSDEQIRIITFNTAGGTYRLTTRAETDYSVRIGGITNLKFEFGFSLDPPTSMADTSLEPSWKHQNYLSIHVQNHKFIMCLFKATIIPLDNGEFLFEEFDVWFMYREEVMYFTEKFTMPRGGFKIRISGFDADGLEFERIRSTGIVEDGNNVDNICKR